MRARLPEQAGGVGLTPVKGIGRWERVCTMSRSVLVKGRSSEVNWTSGWGKTRRKPTVLFRFEGWFLFRLAERAFVAELNHLSLIHI